MDTSEVLVRIELCKFWSGALVAQAIEPDITQDGEQPAFHVAVGTKAFLGLQSAKICFLQEIRSHRGVTAEHHSIGIKAIHVSGKSCILHTSTKTSFSGVEM